MRKSQTAGYSKKEEDEAIAYPPYSDFLRECFNSRVRLRAIMHPPRVAKKKGKSANAKMTKAKKAKAKTKKTKAKKEAKKKGKSAKAKEATGNGNNALQQIMKKEKKKAANKKKAMKRKIAQI